MDRGGLSPARQIAAIAVQAALLIGGQLALSPVAGVEVVTVLLLTFSWAFGPRAGALAAAAFSLLRCFIFGFYPSVIVLYLIYYPLFAAVFGLLGRVKPQSYSRLPLWAVFAVNAVLAAVAVCCALCAVTNFLRISRLAVAMIKSLLWVIFALACALLIVFDVLILLQRAGRLNLKGAVGGRALTLCLAAALAALFTIFFTLADDFITPLFMGWGIFSESSAAYFYASFLSMVPQTLCAIVSVSVLFWPLLAIFMRAAGRAEYLK